jgi:hypothetical protein
LANLTITISNRIGVFGPAASSKWGAVDWNNFLWGEGAFTATDVGKFLSESLTLTDLTTKVPSNIVLNTLDITSAISSLVLRDGAGYVYNFPDRATDGEDRDFTTWTEGTGNSTTWTPPTDPSTTWS